VAVKPIISIIYI